ncbi:hypothetical protein [Vampirovibrio chlorellavorus]|uniref:hypothetical protein n=1 Tax=Vampirovibrio chlorellavorus TaxID=758823 RepID=UPI0026ED1A18|nr:hypothetical protein [Vampirovibrio chlorellavorus]
MSKVDSSYGSNPDYDVWRLSQPPTASDGADLYIEKLLTQAGLAPSKANKDKFEKAGVASAQKNKTFADQALKWASIIFAGALGVVGLRYALGSGTAKAAAGAVEKTTGAVKVAAETAIKATEAAVKAS